MKSLFPANTDLQSVLHHLAFSTRSAKKPVRQLLHDLSPQFAVFLRKTYAQRLTGEDYAELRISQLFGWGGRWRLGRDAMLRVWRRQRNNSFYFDKKTESQFFHQNRTPMIKKEKSRKKAVRKARRPNQEERPKEKNRIGYGATLRLCFWYAVWWGFRKMRLGAAKYRRKLFQRWKMSQKLWIKPSI